MFTVVFVRTPNLPLVARPVNYFWMNSPATKQYTATEYFLKNTGYWFKLLRLSRRMSLQTASSRSGVCENALRDFENGRGKATHFETVLRLCQLYQVTSCVLIYTSMPSATDQAEVHVKGLDLANHLRCKNTPMPETREGKELDTIWADWAKPYLDRFYERVGKSGE